MAARASSRLLQRLNTSRCTANRQIRSYASSSKSYEKPLYPSVEALLHTHNLSASDIKGTGPNGRILKGDVLAHIGDIKASYPKELSQKLSKMSHLDLSNVKPAAPKKAEDAKASTAQSIEAGEEAPEIFELSLPIDLKPVLQLQQRLQDTLGHAPPLTELITRAINLANIGLPAASRAPTADQLFDDIIGNGSSRIQRLSDGRYIPAITQPEPIAFLPPSLDPFDELVSPPAPRRKAPVPQPVPSEFSGAVNEFSVAAAPEEQKRVTVFLQRMKSVLEIEPGRLVL